ncbi:MAG: hypothetical protein JOS17DRAFT_355471 [Linnemannia elongata]|nr:MAG: hypothetical protein JOS17DRAFT_355471 [Linnemannia elongata]
MTHSSSLGGAFFSFSLSFPLFFFFFFFPILNAHPPYHIIHMHSPTYSTCSLFFIFLQIPYQTPPRLFFSD